MNNEHGNAVIGLEACGLDHWNRGSGYTKNATVWSYQDEKATVLAAI